MGFEPRNFRMPAERTTNSATYPHGTLSQLVNLVFLHFSHIVKPMGLTTTNRRCRAYSLINDVGDPTCRAYRKQQSRPSRKQQNMPSFLNGKLCHTSKK